MHVRPKERHGLLTASGAERKVWNRFSPRAFRESMVLCLDLRLLVYRTVREQIALFYATQFAVVMATLGNAYCDHSQNVQAQFVGASPAWI